LGIGDWGLGPIPNPQSPIPNPQSPRNFINIYKFFIFIIIIIYYIFIISKYNKIIIRKDMKKLPKFKGIKSEINLREIKSSYIIQYIFSFLNENQKLIMIMHNKELQKKCSIDIEYYKKISRRQKFIEKNGKGKEYILGTNRLVFEGEYLNGRRNGKGKEYNYYGELEFEGEYLKGKRNAKIL